MPTAVGSPGSALLPSWSIALQRKVTNWFDGILWDLSHVLKSCGQQAKATETERMSLAGGFQMGRG